MFNLCKWSGRLFKARQEAELPAVEVALINHIRDNRPAWELLDRRFEEDPPGQRDMLLRHSAFNISVRLQYRETRGTLTAIGNANGLPLQDGTATALAEYLLEAKRKEVAASIIEKLSQ